MRISQINLDYLGFSASFICALHCLAIPFLITFGMFSGLTWLDNHIVETILIITTIILAISSLIPSFINQHKNTSPIILAGIGFAFLVTSRFMEGDLEHYTTAIGGIFIAVAHFQNWRILRHFSKKLENTPTTSRHN
ncbi:MAG: MerC domain-containing protein [Saprospiraceae bacterium]|nr:MerC domain-containing protein [Saprospiraceae bacterium]